MFQSGIPRPRTGVRTTKVARLVTGSSSRRHLCQLPTVPLFINGEPISESSGGSTTNRHSKTREESCSVVVAGSEETDRALKSSKKAFEQWRDTTGWERRKILVKVLELLQERFRLFSQKLLADVSMSQVLIGADQRSSINLTDGAAQTAISIEGYIPNTIDGSTVMTTREPFGPVLSIPAFNFPMTLALRSIVYPLACGNTVIFKSSRYIPQLHSLFGPLFKDAGLPSGALQILNYSEENVAKGVERIIASPEVRMINFTGSTQLGRILAEQCGRHLKPSIMELGGKSAVIVLTSADIKLAANNIVFGAMFNSGQVCMSTERVLVHDSVRAELETALRNAIESIQGKEFELVRDGAASEVQQVEQDATKNTLHQGSHALISSSKPTQSSTARKPLVILDPSPTSRISQEETFSPTFTLSSFSTTSDALSKLNEVNMGLSTSIFGSISDALPLSKKVESGSVHINGMSIHDEHNLPFGGVSDSGWGRFNGKGAVEGFTWLKNVRIVNDPHPLPVEAL